MFRLFSSLHVCFCLAFTFGVSFGCLELRGIGNSTGDVYTKEDLSSLPLDGVFFFFWFRLLAARVPDVLSLRETPIQIRVLVYELIAAYNLLSHYDDVALEYWARQDVSNLRRRCNNDNTDADLFEIHKSVAFGYLGCWLIPIFLPETLDDANEILESYGLDPGICDDGVCDGVLGDDPDLDLLATPWGLAYVVLKETEEYMPFDGWNEDGSFSREYNRIGFQDFRDGDKRYIPVNNPWKLEYESRWQPLLESDSLGFLYNQEHVTPHIGYTAQSFLFTNDEFCQRSEDFQNDPNNDPNYDYDFEMNLAIERSANLTDLKKFFIEIFDDKNVLNFIRDTFLRSIGISGDNAQRASLLLMNHLSLYESVIAVWKEKVDYDRVRPTSIVHARIGDQTITGYAGTTADGESFGTQTFLAKDWEPYIRTMPHTEYPSASACMCFAWANAFIEYFGVDDWSEQLPNGNVRTWTQFSSEVEPLSTPSQDISYSFSSFSEVSQICGQSRLWGGMHFTKSIEAGQELCKNIGQRAANTMESLYNGEIPDTYLPDINDKVTVERDCYPKKNRNQKKSRSSSSSRSRSSSSD